MFTWDFISGEMKYFHFGVWSISYNCLHDQPELKLVAGLISLGSFWQKWNFILGHKISCKQHSKWNHIKGNICACASKNTWLLVNGPPISDHPRNEIHFISPAMKSNVNGIPFMVGWISFLEDFISGLMETPLLMKYVKLNFSWQ